MVKLKPIDFLIIDHVTKRQEAVRVGKRNFQKLSSLICLMISLLTQIGFSQTIMFDDFNYTEVNDPQLSMFNKWNIIDGISGPPEGALYRKSNIDFVTDPVDSANKIMTLQTTANGQTGATTHARIETSGFDYFEGTYAARIYLSDESYDSKDANIQTFYTIVSSALAQDGSKYSELDIVEYMAADKWGVSPDNRVGYTTSYHKYIAVPWTAWKTYTAQQKSLAGWHTFIATCTDGVNIRYYMDSILIATHSVTDNTTQAGLSVYPRSNMQVAFANWIWNSVLGSSTGNRNNTFMVDWVLYYKNKALSTTQVNDLVASYRSQGLKRRNLVGQTFIETPDPTTGNVRLYLDCPYSGTTVGLSEGSYTMTQLAALGVPNDNVSSLRVQPGYKATLYWDDNFSGASLVKTSDDSC
ncbi:glycoside hydrolase family 16 protein, partial [Aquimarina sp. M1]